MPIQYWLVIYLVMGVIYFAVAAKFPSIFGKSYELLGLASAGDGSGCPITVVSVVLWPLTLLLGLAFQVMTLRPPNENRAMSKQSDASRSLTPNNSIPQVGNEQGVAMTARRPAGKVRIGDETYEATAGHTFIDKGSRVRVVEVRGATLLVSQVE